MTFRPLLAVHSSYFLYGQALRLTRRHSLSWHDSLIVAAAIESDCRILYLEDLEHSQKFDNLRIRNPVALRALFHAAPASLLAFSCFRRGCFSSLSPLLATMKKTGVGYRVPSLLYRESSTEVASFSICSKANCPHAAMTSRPREYLVNAGTPFSSRIP
jgi:hypothetical protein